MGKAKYNWEYLRPIICQLRAEGESMKEIAKAVDVNLRSLYIWWNKYGNPVFEKKSKKRYYVKPKQEQKQEPIDYADIFKSKLKIGNKIEVKTIDGVIKGTVIEKYPYIFTINCGKWKESFGYNCYMDIKVKSR